MSALDRYRRTLVFAAQGLSPAALRALGGGASSFSMRSGDPDARARLYDIGLYFQDNWRVQPNIMLGLGLRYEAQNNLHSAHDIAPRFSVAWSPKTAQKENPHTVLRIGTGLFYERLDDTLVLQANRSRHPRWQYSTSDPAVLDFFPRTPPLAALAPFATPVDTIALSPHLETPSTWQSTASLEKELPLKTRLAASFTYATTHRDWLVVDTTPFQKGHPRFLELQSSGLLTQRQLKLGFSNSLSKRVSLSASYVNNYAQSNTDGIKNPAANPNFLKQEFGRSVKDMRHNFTLTGSINAPWGLRLSPFVVASSGRPFNIMTGIYEDEDIPVTERPAFAADPSQPGVILTRFGAFTLDTLPGVAYIPRNYAQGRPFFSASFRVSKTLSFGDSGPSSTNDRSANDTATPGNAERRYSVILTAQVINVTNHLNAGTPVRRYAGRPPYFV